MSHSVTAGNGQVIGDSSGGTSPGTLGDTVAADTHDPAWSSDGPWLLFDDGDMCMLHAPPRSSRGTSPSKRGSPIVRPRRWATWGPTQALVGEAVRGADHYFSGGGDQK